jgi:hypothetical protein
LLRLAEVIGSLNALTWRKSVKARRRTESGGCRERRARESFRKKTLRLVARCCNDIEADRPVDEKLRAEAVANYRLDAMPEWFKAAMKKRTGTRDMIARINRDPLWVSAATTVLGCLVTEAIGLKRADDPRGRILAILWLWLGDNWLQRVASEGSWFPPEEHPRAHTARSTP